MVCEKCEKKLSKVIVPDKWKEGASNTTEGGGRKINENKLLSKKNRYHPQHLGTPRLEELIRSSSTCTKGLKQMCTENGAGPERDELDFEFLGNRTGQPYLIQTNVYKNGTGNREMRHSLWFDPTEDYHTYSILWNSHQIVFFVDRVPVRVFKNNGKQNNFFPDEKPMYLFSSIWNADDWATRGGLEKTNWKLAPFVSSYKDFSVDACQWEDPYPACVSTTTKHWWDQYDAWHLSDDQKKDFAWVERNLVIYDYCKDTERFTTLPEECSLSPWD